MREGWQFKELDELFEVGSAKRVLKAQWQSKGVPFYRGREITKLSIHGYIDNDLFISEELYGEYKAKYGVPSAGDIVITAIGTIGNSYIVREADRFYYKDASVLCLRKISDTDSRFINFWLKSAQMRSQLDEGNGATVDTLTITKMKGLKIDLPPLPEQNRIVAILDKAFEGIDASIANTQKNLVNARELFDGDLNDLFLKNAGGWIETPLESVCRFSSGGTPSKKNSSYWEGSVPWVSGRDMKSTKLYDTALHISQQAVDQSSTRMAPVGALLTLVRGMGLAHGAQITELMVPCAFNQDIRAIQPNCDIVPRYLLFALRTQIDSSDNVLSQAAHGTLKIDMNELKKVQIPIPNPERQRQIVVRIDALFKETQQLESIYQQKLDALNELKQSLLAKAFSGELTAQPEKVLKEAIG